MLLQPPSGGCVLKHENPKIRGNDAIAAAFGRLCVETSILLDNKKFTLAAAFGRLCVETTGVSKL